MRALCLLLMLAATPVALGAWTSASEAVPPACTVQDKKGQTVVLRDGYRLACGPGAAVVRSNGSTYRLRGSKCVDGARLYFGVSSNRWRSPQNGLYLVVEPHGKAGPVNVIDGGVELVTGVRSAISGKARVYRGLKRGTFTVFGRQGARREPGAPRFTGSWNCG